MNDAGPHSSPLERARAIAPLIREDAHAGERLGRLTDRVAEAIVGNNLCSTMVPATSVGLGASRVAHFEATEEIARADGSAGWCLAVCNSNSVLVHRGASDALRDEVFGGGPVACWASLAPKGRSEAEGDGFRFTGSFAWGSGSAMARWLLASSPLPDRDGFQWFRAHVVPKEDVTLKEGSWDVMGLKATHSVDYEVDALVPRHRTFEYPMVREANPGGVFGQEAMAIGQIGLVAFASGVAQAALEELLALAPKTKRLAAEGMQADDHTVQFGIGELEGRLRAARAWYLDLLAQFDALPGSGAAPPSPLDVFQAAQTLTRAARDMAVFAFDNAGTSVVYSSQPLQRALRDLFTGLKHAQLTPAILGRIGKVRLGQEFAQTRF